MREHLPQAPDLVLIADMGNEVPGAPSLTNSTKGALEGTLRVDVVTKSGHTGTRPVSDPQAIAFRLFERVSPNGIVIDELQPEPPSSTVEQNLARLPFFDPNYYATKVGLLPGVSLPDGIVSPAHLIAWDSLLVTDRPFRPVEGPWVTAPFVEVGFALRLGPGVDPEKAKRIVTEKLTENVGQGIASLKWKQVSYSWSTSADGPAMELANQVFSRQFGQKAVVHGAGGGLPFLRDLSRQGTVPVIAVGAVDGDSAIHAPKESLSVETMMNTVFSIYYLILGYGSSP